MYREEAEAMRDYLKEYGTFQQQKLAIAEEYAEKIRKAQSQGERLTLEKQRDAAVHKVDMESLTQKIDWGAAFGDLTGLLADQMKNLLGELKQYVKTDEFKKSGAADQQVVYDAIERIQSMLPRWQRHIGFCPAANADARFGGCRNTCAKCRTAAGSGIHPVESGAGRLQQGS